MQNDDLKSLPVDEVVEKVGVAQAIGIKKVASLLFTYRCTKEKTFFRELIQVCWDLSDPKTKKREIDSLIKASQALKCNNLLVVTSDFEGEEKIKERRIKFLPLWKWLLQMNS